MTQIRRIFVFIPDRFNTWNKFTVLREDKPLNRNLQLCFRGSC